MSIDARLAYDVWVRLIGDEELYSAVIAGTHRALGTSHDLGPAQLDVLDAFHREKGTRWNIENLRFRTALEAGATLTSYLPRTIKLLTNGDDNWLQDISFEYLAHYRWVMHGHHRFAECERFGTYVRERIMKRRITPVHLEAVLDFELEMVRLLKHTATIAPEAWTPSPTLGDDAILAARLGRGPAVLIVEVPVDLREWIESGDPARGVVRPHPITLLAYVTSLRDSHRIKMLSEGTKLVLESFDGRRSTREIADELAVEYDLDPAQIVALVRTWLADRVLAVAA